MRSQEQRLQRNDESRNKAAHHREEWSADEVAFLLDWDGTDEELGIIAECLGRTREACRERFYKTKRGEATSPVEVKHVKVTRGLSDTTTTYLGVEDDPDDQWWSPEEVRAHHG